MTDRDSSKPLTDADLARLDELLQHGAGDLGVGSLSMLDGYLTAMIIAPPAVERMSWMDDLCGRPVAEVLESSNLGEILSLALRYYGRLLEQLVLGRGYSPRLASVPGDPEALDPQPWCAGFLRAVDLDWDVWESMLPSIQEPLSAIMAHGGGDEEPLTTEPDEHDRASVVDSLYQAVTAIHEANLMMYDPALDAPGVSVSSPTEPYLAPPKVGRNEPCPCGSGRKYKKCCRS